MTPDLHLQEAFRIPVGNHLQLLIGQQAARLQLLDLIPSLLVELEGIVHAVHDTLCLGIFL